MNTKIFLPLIFSIFLLSGISAMTVYSDFTDSSQSTTITLGDSISFNVDFFSMHPPITSMKVQLVQGSSVIHTFLNSNTNSQTYYHTYTYTPTATGTYTIQVIGKDNINTDSEFLTLKVNPFVPTNHAPVITILGSNPVTIIQGDTYTDAGATATDFEDGSLTSSIITSGTVNTNIIGTYLITYSVTDSDSNTATATRTIHVVSQTDTIPPVITLFGPNPQTIIQGNSYNEYGATATDNIDGDLTSNIIIDSSDVNTNVVGTYFVTYDVQDSSGNAAITEIRTVHVILSNPSNHAPVITSSPVTSVIEGNVYNYNVDATDSDGDNLDYSIITGPGWLSINPNTGLITGTAPQVNSNTNYQVEIEVSDGNGGTDTQTYTLKVKDADNDNECNDNDCTSTRVIQENQYDKNKYLNQYKSTGIVSAETLTTQKASGLSVSAFFYIILFIVGLGIIVALLIIFKNISGYTTQPVQKSKFNETYY